MWDSDIFPSLPALVKTQDLDNKSKKIEEIKIKPNATLSKNTATSFDSIRELSLLFKESFTFSYVNWRLINSFCHIQNANFLLSPTAPLKYTQCGNCQDFPAHSDKTCSRDTSHCFSHTELSHHNVESKISITTQNLYLIAYFYDLIILTPAYFRLDAFKIKNGELTSICLLKPLINNSFPALFSR